MYTFFIKFGIIEVGIGDLYWKGATVMKTFLILAVTVSFLTAIFTAGYNDKPESHE